jgi:FKBP-type peptidyl-prolyl cis-trans isomerase FkpA
MPMICLKNHKISLISIIVILIVISCKGKPHELTEIEMHENSLKLEKINRILLKKDQKRIEGYLKRNNLEMKETGTGLWYKIESDGQGEKASKGKIATLNYSISLLDGTECYNSKKDGLKTFRIGMGGVESGLEEGILLMKTGDKAKFIMPPYMAQGLVGDNNRIPARSTIVYDVELLSLQ